MSSSLVPSNGTSEDITCKSNLNDWVSVVALWSRTVACHECSYIPLDEEVMGGWDAIYGGEHDVHGAIICPRCGSLLTPKLAYKEMTLGEALECVEESTGTPRQITTEIEDHTGLLVTYLSPASLRDGLEQATDQHGEGILEREKLRELYPELFINLWWFCARFQLPLPLPVAVDADINPKNYFAVAAWYDMLLV